MDTFQDMESLKKIIITCVTFFISASSFFVILLLIKAKNLKRDVTYPLLASVFTSGIAENVCCLLIIVVVWNDLQHNVILIKVSFFWLILAVQTNYLSISTLSCLKFFAVVAPFTYKRVVTVGIVKAITVTIWVLVSLAVSLVVYFSKVYFSHFTNTPRYDLTKPMETKAIYYTRTVLYMSIGILLITSIGFVIADVRHKIRIRMIVAAEEMMDVNRRRTAVTKALWSSKGVWILAIVRLTLHLPFWALAETKLRDSENSFFVMWLMPLLIPFWDAVCYVGFHKGLRRLAAKTLCLCRCNNDISELVPSRITSVNSHAVQMESKQPAPTSLMRSRALVPRAPTGQTPICYLNVNNNIV